MFCSFAALQASSAGISASQGVGYVTDTQGNLWQNLRRLLLVGAGMVRLSLMSPLPYFSEVVWVVFASEPV